jgi:hypothetical protein
LTRWFVPGGSERFVRKVAMAEHYFYAIAL